MKKLIRVTAAIAFAVGMSFPMANAQTTCGENGCTMAGRICPPSYGDCCIYGGNQCFRTIVAQ